MMCECNVETGCVCLTEREAIRRRGKIRDRKNTHKERYRKILTDREIEKNTK